MMKMHYLVIPERAEVNFTLEIQVKIVEVQRQLSRSFIPVEQSHQVPAPRRPFQIELDSPGSWIVEPVQDMRSFTDQREQDLGDMQALRRKIGQVIGKKKGTPTYSDNRSQGLYFRLGKARIGFTALGGTQEQAIRVIDPPTPVQRGAG